MRAAPGPRLLAGILWSEIIRCRRAAGGVGTLTQGGLEDHVIEPLADRHAGAASSFVRGMTRLAPYPLNVPWNARFHARNRILNREEREPDGPWWGPELVNSRWITARPCAPGRSFCPLR